MGSKKIFALRCRALVMLGSTLQHCLHASGYKIVAVSDSKGGVYREQGFDIPSLIHAKNETQQVKAVYCEESVL